MGTNNGTSIGAGSYVTGKVDQTIGFSISSSRIQVNNSPSLNFGSNADFSIEAWIKIPRPRPIFTWPGRWPSPDTDSIIEKRSDSLFGLTEVGSALFLRAGQLAFWRNASSRSATSGLQLLAGGWDLRDALFHHVAVSLTRGATNGGKLYVDAEEVLTFDPTTQRGDLSNPDPLLIGAQDGSGWIVIGSNSSDLIDEPAIYNRALAAAEILAIRNAGVAGKCKTPPSIVTQPARQRVAVGSNAIFSVTTTGSPLLRYQWLRSGQILPGTTNSSFTIKNVSSASNPGPFSCRVTNLFGLVVSSNAMLEVNYPPLADASASVTPVLAPLNGLATVGLDGSRSSDPDNNPLTYTWGLGSNPLGTGVVTVVHLPAGQPAIALVVDDGLAQNTNVIRLEILTPAQAIERVAGFVRESAPRRQPLLATLQAAVASVNRGDPTPAINQLQAFQNKVQAQVGPEDPALANTLKRMVQEVIEVRGGETLSDREPVRIHQATRQADGRVRVKISGGSKRVYIIEASTDLVHWEAIGVARDAGQNLFDFENVRAAQFPGRFYRVAVP